MADSARKAAADGDSETLAGFGPEALQGLLARMHSREDGSDPLLGQRLGPYRLLRILGVGGFGVVYEAEQEEGVRRRVAVKVAARGQMSHEAAVRLYDEQQTLASLNDPSIVTLLDVGVEPPSAEGEPGRPFLVMELAEGRPITEYAEAHALTLVQRLELLARAAGGVAAAHRRGVIHRDLKPAHMLVDEAGAVRLIDFGVARTDVAERLSNTMTGQMIGTLRYMSPEQRAGRTRDVDTRSDVYALGVVLAELVVGPRFKEIEPTIIARTPTSDLLTDSRRATRRRCRRDVDWIVGKALSEDPDDRYTSVDAFRQDLLRAVAGETVLARPRSMLLPVRSFVRRHPVVSAVSAVSLVTLSSAAWVVTGLWLENMSLADAALREANGAKLEAYVAQLTGGQSALMVGAVGAARNLLDATDEDSREWTWEHLHYRASPQGRAIIELPRDSTTSRDKLQSLALSSDGGLLLTGNAAGDLWLVDTGSNEVVSRGSLPDQVFCIAPEPGPGGGMIVGCADSSLYQYPGADISGGATRIVLPHPPISIAVHPHGGLLAVGCVETGEVYLVDLESGEIADRLLSTGDNCFEVVFDPTGEYLYVGTDNGRVELWSVASRSRQSIVTVDSTRVQGLAVSADGRTLLSCTLGGRLSVLTVTPKGSLVQAADLQEQSGLVTCAFHPDGRTLVTSGIDGAIRRRSIAGLGLEGEWFQHDQPIYAAAIGPDSGVIYSCAIDGTVRLVDPRTNPAAINRIVLTDANVLWDSSATWMLESEHGTFTLVHAESGRSCYTQTYPELASRSTYSAWLAPDGTLACYDILGTTLRVLDAGGSVVHEHRFSTADGAPIGYVGIIEHRIARSDIVNLDESTAVLRFEPAGLVSIDLDTGTLTDLTSLVPIDDQPDLKGLFDGGLLAKSSSGGVTLVLPDGQAHELPGLQKPTRLWHASLDGDYLLVGWDDGANTDTASPLLTIYDMVAKRVVMDLLNDGLGMKAAAVSPDRRTLAVARRDGPVDLILIPSGRRLLTLPGSEPASVLSFDANGTLRLGTDRGTLRLWRVGPGVYGPHVQHARASAGNRTGD